MEQKINKPEFPEQNEPAKMHGTTDDSGMKEKYIRDSGKIEDMPGQKKREEDKKAADAKRSDKSESTHLTDTSGEEKKEDYINTDERKRDLDRRGL